MHLYANEPKWVKVLMVLSLVLSALVDQTYVKTKFPAAHGILTTVASVLSAVLLAFTKKDETTPPPNGKG